MMNFHELIYNRESIRDYDPERIVEKEKLTRILEAGRLAPSAANRQPWKFILVSSPEMLEKVRSCYHKQWFKDAPHILIVSGNKNEAWTKGYDGYCSIETDLTIAMDHMILAAEFEGIATCWIAAFDPSALYKALSLKKQEKIFAITPLGYPRQNFTKKNLKIRKSFDEVVRLL